MAKEITSAQHPLIKHWGKLAENAAYRKQKGTVLLEGEQMIKELSKRFPIATLILEKHKQEDVEIPSKERIIVSRTLIEKISRVQNPEGVLAEIALPHLPIPKKIHHLLVLEEIRDPGNLGTLWRTALALGWDAVFLLGNCCDPFNDKAIRAAKGATFYLPFIKGDWDKLQTLIKQHHLQPFVADMNGTPVEHLKGLNDKVLLLLGNESQGPSSIVKKHFQPIAIPMSAETESLNVGVAGGILMYLLRI